MLLKYGLKYFTFLAYLGYIENQLYGQNFFNDHWCLLPFITNLIDTTRPKCMQNLSCIPSRYVTFLFISSLQSYSAQRNPISKTISINAYVCKYYFMPKTLMKTLRTKTSIKIRMQKHILLAEDFIEKISFSQFFCDDRTLMLS